jgi:hypothetical protein
MLRDNPDLRGDPVVVGDPASGCRGGGDREKSVNGDNFSAVAARIDGGIARRSIP